MMYKRTEMLIGKEATEKIKNAHVAVFGLGGVGGYTVEALVRAGVGKIDITDNDKVSESNINRQIIATVDTLGEYKTDAFEKRILSINPDCKVTKHNVFYLPGKDHDIDFSKFDYIVDAIDTISAKIDLVLTATSMNIPIISCMGTGNKLDPTAFEISDIYKTSVCPLAKVMRRELKKRDVKELKVLYSKEKPVKNATDETLEITGKTVPGSISYVPSVAGLIIAGEVIKDISGI